MQQPSEHLVIPVNEPSSVPCPCCRLAFAPPPQTRFHQLTATQEKLQLGTRSSFLGTEGTKRLHRILPSGRLEAHLKVDLIARGWLRQDGIPGDGRGNIDLSNSQIIPCH